MFGLCLAGVGRNLTSQRFVDIESRPTGGPITSPVRAAARHPDNCNACAATPSRPRSTFMNAHSSSNLQGRVMFYLGRCPLGLKTSSRCPRHLAGLSPDPYVHARCSYFNTRSTRCRTRLAVSRSYIPRSGRPDNQAVHRPSAPAP